MSKERPSVFHSRFQVAHGRDDTPAAKRVEPLIAHTAGEDSAAGVQTGTAVNEHADLSKRANLQAREALW